MSEELPPTIGESIDEVLLCRMPPDLLEQYHECKRRHRDELKDIERFAHRARIFLRRWTGDVRQQKAAELRDEKAERINQENERFHRRVRELIDMWRDRTQEQAE